MTPRRSHRLIGLVRGQFDDIPEVECLDFLASTGFDGWEEAAWEIDLAACDIAAGAKATATERVALARDRGLMILSVATHLLGQALGDEPSAKTLAFVGGEAVDAYVAWRHGHEPPRTDPYYVPAELGRLNRPAITSASWNGRATAATWWASTSTPATWCGWACRRSSSSGPSPRGSTQPISRACRWRRPPTRAGLLGGHRPMRHRLNGWNFVTAGNRRDAVPVEEVIVELNRAGYSCGFVFEWEDNDAEKRAGAGGRAGRRSASVVWPARRHAARGSAA